MTKEQETLQSLANGNGSQQVSKKKKGSNVRSLGKTCRSSKRKRTMYQSDYHGVSWNRKTKNYVAECKVNNGTIHLGNYVSEMEAGLVVDNCISSSDGAKEKYNFSSVIERNIAWLIIKHFKNLIINRTPTKNEGNALKALRGIGKGVAKDKNGYPNKLDEILENIIALDTILLDEDSNPTA